MVVHQPNDRVECQECVQRGPNHLVTRGWLSPALITVCLAVHLSMLTWQARRNSPAWDETSHLVSGVSHWELGTFDLYRVNPPLVRLLAGIGCLLGQPETDWRFYDSRPGIRSERSIRKKFALANGRRVFHLVWMARLFCIPLSAVGALVCMKWSSDLYGRNAGMMALVLWCVSPNVLAHAHLITPDAAAATFGISAGYVYWKWLVWRTWTRALVAGACLGLALLAKSTWVLFLGLWPMLAVVWYILSFHRTQRPKATDALQLAAVLAAGLLVLNAGYGFEGSLTKLGEYEFVSDMLGGPRQQTGTLIEPRNRFSETWLADVPVPVPRNFLMGMDLQKWDFERKFPSYLAGEWRRGGWWYYYLYALCIKVPLGLWLLFFLAAGVTLFCDGYSRSPQDELMLLVPPAIVLVLVSSQTGFNHHLRYVLPAFPFVFVWVSKVAQSLGFRHQAIAVVACLGLAWSATSSLWIYPHSLSYFNELVGGPLQGHRHLLDSNIDWGQDLLYFERWLDENPQATPLHLAYHGVHDADDLAGIRYKLPPTSPKPGWHALSVSKIQRSRRDYVYFLRFRPVATAGYSIYIYYITLEDANRVRAELGRSLLPRQGGQKANIQAAARPLSRRGSAQRSNRAEPIWTNSPLLPVDTTH